MSDVKVKFLGLTALERKLDDPAAKAVLHKKIGAIYRSFAAERFSTQSRGGGDWPDLSEATKRARRKAKAAKKAAKKAADDSTKKKKKKKPTKKAAKKPAPVEKFAILIDKGLLFAAFAPVLASGAIEESTGSTVRLGFGGPGAHGNSGATIADIAAFHQFGGGRLPARPLIVEPDDTTMALLKKQTIKWLMTR